MKKHSRNTMWSLAWVWLAVLLCGVAHASAPNWSVVTYPFYTGVMARVLIDGEPVRSAGSKLAAFQGDEVRGVADIRGGNQAENIDGEYYFNLMFGSEDANEKNFTFKLWNSADDQIYNLDSTLDFDVNYPQKPDIYGGFVNGGAFVPCVMSNESGDIKYHINITNGTATVNGVPVTEASYGEVVTITANPPSTSQGLKIWNTGDVSNFIGSILGPTTTFVMPRNNVTITPSFVAKSSMPAVAVRSTTNAGDDTATEPEAGSTASDKGKFTFTRTTSSGALTVCFSIRGTATNGVDYKSIQSSVTFASGKTSVSIDIEPLADGIYEGDETVTVVLEPDPSAPTQTYRGGTVTDATVTIVDVDEHEGNDIVYLQYILYPEAAVAAGAQWRIDNGDWIDSGEYVTTSIGSHTITFKDVPGYITPEPAYYPDMPIVPIGIPRIGASATYEQAPIQNEYTLTVTGGKIDLNGVMVSSAQFTPGDIVTITANPPSTSQALKIWTPDKDVEFIGSVLGATTTIVMPPYDVTVAASFVAKSSMPAVSVKSTAAAGDDTAKEPSTATASATDKGKFTFTRTTVNQSRALTVYYSVRGTAANGVDYKSIPSSVTFAANATSVSVEIEPLFDGIDEGDETVEVVLEPEQGTQTYRGGTYTDASITIEDTPGPAPVVNGTIKYTLVSDAGTTVAGAQWKIDNGSWNNSDTAVTASVGSHTITFKDVANYTTPASQTVTVSQGAETQGTATYIYNNQTPVDYLLKLTGGKIDGTGATEGRYVPGDLVVITATLPSNQGLKIWTPDKDVEFLNSVLATTTTIVMPAYDVTIAASFVTKSSMPAVSVRSTTNTGDDTAKEPTSATAAADKGKFTFTRTSVNQSKALTVYYSIRGTAENGVDYKSIPSSVTFAANSTSATVEIEPLYDDILEDYETVEVVLEPEQGTQTYRGGTYTDASITIENSGGGIAPVYSTVKYTLLSNTGTPVAGAQWKIDDGEWNNSDTAVTVRIGEHTVTFKDVANYTTPAQQTIVVSEGVETQGTATYIYNPVPVQYNLTVSGGKINGTATTGRFYPGEEVSITATLPTNKGLKIWTPDKDVEFIGSKLAGTTTIRMPAYDVTVTASFVTKSDMPAVSVRSTTNTGDDTAKEPASATATADKGKFTFTRTSVNQSRALTVYYSIRGTATNGVDYKSIQSSVTFAASTTSVSVEIEPLFDGVSESDETVEVVLEPEQGTQTYRGGTYTDASIKIENTDPDNPVLPDPYHPADCVVQDYIITGTEYLQYVGPVKAVALSNKEYEWDGTNLLSIAAKATQNSNAPQTRGGGVAIERTVSPAVYSAGSTVVVTLTISGADRMSNLFIGEKIPAGWTVLGNAAGSVANGVLKMTWDSPSIPATYSYSIKAPTANLAESYVIASSADDTACFTDEMEFIHIADTALLNSSNNYVYHPADCVNKDRRISGIEYLMYAGPVQALALANEAYTWNGVDVLSIRKKNSTRGGAADDVALARTVDTTTYEAGSQVAVTLSISGADGMVSLFIGEKIPDGWSVAGDYAANVKNGVLRMTWDAPNIPETVTYTLQAPETDPAPVCRIATSTADTGCFTDHVVFLNAEDTFLTLDTELKTAEWPQDLKLYTPAAGRTFRANDKLAVTFSWPAVLNAESYRLVVATYDGAVVFDELVDETVCTVSGLACGSFVWNVAAVGDDCIAGCTDDFLFAIVPDVPAPIICGASADGATVLLSFDTADAGYKDGVFACQMVFFSMKTSSWISLTENLQITNGQAVVDLGVDASNGYLYVRPVTTPESDFVELYVK